MVISLISFCKLMKSSKDNSKSAVYEGTNKIVTDCSFKFDSKKGRMETLISTKRATNPIYTKLFVDQDNVSCSILSVPKDGAREFI